MSSYDISAEADHQLAKGFAKVTGAAISSIPSETLLNKSSAKSFCGRGDTLVEIMKKNSEFYTYQFDGKQNSDVGKRHKVMNLAIRFKTVNETISFVKR